MTPVKPYNDLSIKNMERGDKMNDFELTFLTYQDLGTPFVKNLLVIYKGDEVPLKLNLKEKNFFLPI